MSIGSSGYQLGKEIHQLLPEDPPETHGQTSYYHLHKLPTLFHCLIRTEISPFILHTK